jgi:hypothetical protein
VVSSTLFFFRTDDKFQNHLKKGIVLNATDYLLPTEICAMVNVVIDAKNQSLKLCAVDGVDVVSFLYTMKLSKS